jgi:hypothetical protein
MSALQSLCFGIETALPFLQISTTIQPGEFDGKDHSRRHDNGEGE